MRKHHGRHSDALTAGEDEAPFDDDTPLSLQEAAATLLRGLVTASTLRAAAARRELTVERIGRLYVVTPAAVKAWRARCRVEAEPPTSTSRGAGTAPASGTSATDSGASAQLAAQMRLRAQKERLKATKAAKEP